MKSPNKYEIASYNSPAELETDIQKSIGKANFLFTIAHCLLDLANSKYSPSFKQNDNYLAGRILEDKAVNYVLLKHCKALIEVSLKELSDDSIELCERMDEVYSRMQELFVLIEVEIKRVTKNLDVDKVDVDQKFHSTIHNIAATLCNIADKSGFGNIEEYYETYKLALYYYHLLYDPIGESSNNDSVAKYKKFVENKLELIERNKFKNLDYDEIMKNWTSLE